MDVRPWAPPPRYLFRRYNVIRQIGQLQSAKTFLDIGCGAGDLDCLLVKDLKMAGEGIDFSESAIVTANQLKKYFGLGGQPVFKLIDGQIPKETKKADVVICLEVLEHVKDDEKLLKDLVSLSNRFVMISVPAKQRLFTHSDRLAGHYRRYEKEILRTMLQKNDLRVLSFVSYGYPFTNLIRLVRERVAAKTAGKNKQETMQKRSKKSGVDLMGVNKHFSFPLEQVLLPFYQFSRLFNRFDLAEGYLVVAEKIAPSS